MPSDGPFDVGEKVFYWQVDPSKIKHGKAHGRWIRGKIVGQEGAICIIDPGTALPSVNQSKLRKDHDDWQDAPIPLEEEAAEEQSASLSETLWLATSHGKLYFQELFSGSAHASSACADAGLRTGSPIDLRTGFDLNTQAGQKKAWKQITQQQPTVIFLAPWCLPWCQWSNMVPEPRRSEKRKAALPMVELCVKVALYQISHQRYFLIENPQGSQLWNLSCILHLASFSGVTWQLLNMCAVGLKDRTSGLPFPKGHVSYAQLPCWCYLPVVSLMLRRPPTPGH